MPRSSVVVSALWFAACAVDDPTGTGNQDPTKTKTITVTETVEVPVTVVETNTVTVTVEVPVEPPPPVVYDDVMTPLDVYQVPGLLGAYSHLLDLDIDGSKRATRGGA